MTKFRNVLNFRNALSAILLIAISVEERRRADLQTLVEMYTTVPQMIKTGDTKSHVRQVLESKGFSVGGYTNDVDSVTCQTFFESMSFIHYSILISYSSDDKVIGDVPQVVGLYP
jgi:hypothetical protein